MESSSCLLRVYLTLTCTALAFFHTISQWPYLGMKTSDNLETLYHIMATVKVCFFCRRLTFGVIFISDENIVNNPGNALVFHPRCGGSVSIFNGYRSAHRPRYGYY